MKQEALITQITPLSSHDGRGVRTSIFFKGCSLQCVWCHNPETYDLRQQVMWRRELCIGCGECMKSCDRGALNLTHSIEYIDRELCVACGKCVDSCHAKALRMAAKSYDVETLCGVINRHKPLFMSMNGGVTFSGGEPALHHKFIGDVIDHLDDPKLHFALDTCGQAPLKNYISLLPKLDQILFDIKEIDPIKHREFTGCDNTLILDNLDQIVSYIIENDLPTKIWIRTPLIPNYTARRENIESIARFIKTLPEGVIERWDLCCFNNLCVDKYRQMGVEWQLKEAELLDAKHSEEYLTIARATLPRLEIRASGLTKRASI